MTTSLAHDLRLARRRSGLSQADLAHLIDARQSRISDLECSHTLPTLDEFFTLSLILDRRFDTFCAAELTRIKSEVRDRIPSLLELKRKPALGFNRRRTLARLMTQLEDDGDAYVE